MLKTQSPNEPLQSTAVLVPATPMYGIAPRGMSTGDVESLFSHFLALCHEHRLASRQVAARVLPEVEQRLSPVIGGPRYQVGWAWDKNAGQEMIDMHRHTERWVRVLEAATGLSGLRATTLLPLQAVTLGKFITVDERVCLDCLDADTAEGGLPYGRLLWRMQAVNCCPIHRKRLTLPDCGRGLRSTQIEYVRVKYSSVCRRCCSIGHKCRLSLAEDASEEDVWRAEQCRSVLASSLAIEAAGPEAVRTALRAHCAVRGAACSLALRAGMQKSVLSRWLNNPGTRMSFDQLLDICAAEGLELAELLQGRIVHPAGAGGMAPTRVRRQLKRVDHEGIRRALTDALKVGRSVTEVAAELRVDISTLAKHRDLYVPVREAAARRRAHEEERRHLAAIQKITTIARSLRKQGKRLTPRNALSGGAHNFSPSSAEANALSLIRFGLGDRSVRLPTTAMRTGPRYLQRISEAVDSLRSENGADQLRLTPDAD